MPAYVLAEIEITNPEGYKEYTKAVPATIEKYGGKFIHRGARYRSSRANGRSAAAC